MLKLRMANDSITIVDKVAELLPDCLTGRYPINSFATEFIGLQVGTKDNDDVKEKISPSCYTYGSVYVTNCPRMKKALELCGYEVFDKRTIQGIERFCNL